MRMSRSGKIFLYLIYFAIVAILAGSVIEYSKSNSPAPSPSPAVMQHAQPSTASPHGGGVAAKPAASSPSQTAASNNSTTLDNTGPGNVAGLFVAASITGMVVYRQVVIRRLRA